MPLTVYDPKRPTSEAEINSVEQRLGIKLPADYRSWLLRYNGGQPDPSGFRFKNEGGAYTDGDVAWFLAIHDAPESNFEITFSTFKVMGRRMPENLIPIANDPFGNKICLSIGGDDRGMVYFWDHEEEPAEPSYANCHLIADSFDEFIAGLHD